MVLFLWKVSQGLVKGFEISFTEKLRRRGRTAVVATVPKSSPASVRKARECTLAIRGARIFNLLPAAIRNHDSNQVDTFKTMLDTYLRQVPDQPTVSGRARAAVSNSLLHQIPMMLNTMY